MITVGVVGFPNVGKSSLINSLKKQRSAATGNQPGVTKTMQEIQLDKNIVLLDSPGVVMNTSEQSNALILRQAIKIEDLADPIKPIEALLERVEESEILKLYKIGKYKSVEAMLGQVARKKGLLRHGGIANMDEAARSVIRDFLNGKIKYWTAPPTGFEEGSDEGEDVEME
jgi:nuclear GTP-binding protein